MSKRPMEPEEEYRGSRKKDNRYGNADLMSGLVELAPGSASRMSQEHFASLLRNVGCQVSQNQFAGHGLVRCVEAHAEP